jgi:L-amino acid N-acyltransferase YncA
MIIYSRANTREELEGILTLQQANHAHKLSEQEIQSQGFVTVAHSLELLSALNNIEKHVIAKDDDQVIGYILAMTRQSRNDIPILLPMFDAFDRMEFKNRKISGFNYLVVGQVCVDKNYRGQGIFDACYENYKNHYRQKYDFAITEIAASNLRSLNAHKRVGFEVVDSYKSPDNTEWVVVVWDWQRESIKQESQKNS